MCLNCFGRGTTLYNEVVLLISLLAAVANSVSGTRASSLELRNQVLFTLVGDYWLIPSSTDTRIL
jgi:hypothetical protein